jgi:predicted outer membrane protein
MKKTIAAFSLSVLIAGCAADGNSGASGTSSETISGSASGTPPEETNFARQACHTGVAEAEMGKLAARNTRNPEVRSLAKRLVKDHTEAEKEFGGHFRP